MPLIQQNAAASRPAQKEGEAVIRVESDGSQQGSTEALPPDDMAPFLEQLQGGAGGDLHEVFTPNRPSLLGCMF